MDTTQPTPDPQDVNLEIGRAWRAHRRVLSRFIVDMLAPVGVSRFGDWLSLA